MLCTIYKCQKNKMPIKTVKYLLGFQLCHHNFSPSITLATLQMFCTEFESHAWKFHPQSSFNLYSVIICFCT